MQKPSVARSRPVCERIGTKAREGPLCPAARTDLIEIGERNARDAAGESPLVNALIDRCYSLTDRPELCPPIPRYEAHGIRRLVARQYLIFYRVRPEEIQIVPVLYGGRDWQALLFPEK